MVSAPAANAMSNPLLRIMKLPPRVGRGPGPLDANGGGSRERRTGRRYQTVLRPAARDFNGSGECTLSRRWSKFRIVLLQRHCNFEQELCIFVHIGGRWMR